jgi:hypothetical protein
LVEGHEEAVWRAWFDVEPRAGLSIHGSDVPDECFGDDDLSVVDVELQGVDDVSHVHFRVLVESMDPNQAVFVILGINNSEVVASFNAIGLH